MSRLGKRVQQLEGGRTDGVDLIASVPAAWSAERQASEVPAIALARGAVEPFGHLILLQRFGPSDAAEIIFMGRLGADPHLPQQLTWRGA